MNDDFSANQKRLYKHLLGIVFVGSLLIYGWGIWAIPALSHNEARRMVVVQEMLKNKEWLIPTLNNQIYLAKPPLFYWIAAVFSMISRSTSEWVIRLPSVLSAFALTWILFDRVKKYIGRWEALFSAAILVTSAQFTLFARRAEIEMLLTFFCALSLLFYLDHLKREKDKKYLLFSYGSLGLAFLTKGPVALVFVIAPVLLFGVIRKDKKALKGLLFIPGWLLFLALATPWYLYILTHLEEPMAKVIHRDVTYKAFSLSHRDPFYEYVLVLLGAFLPWILIIFYKTKSQVCSLFRDYESSYFSYGFLVPLVVMSAFAAKHSKYVLPLFPAFAAFLGIWCARLFRDLHARWKDKLYFRSVAAVGILVCGFFLYYAGVEARIYEYRFEAFQPIMSKVQSFGKEKPLFLYKHLYYRLVYYYGKPIPVVDEAEVRDLLSKKQSFLLLVDSRDWDEMQNMNMCILAEYKPFIKKNRGLRMLGSPDLCPGK